MWEITFYNGTVWISKSSMLILDAIKKGLKRTGFHQMDIKQIINLK